MSRNIIFSEGEYYHVYNRGTEKRNIYTNKSDRDRFLALLYLANGSSPIHISNHQGSTLMSLLSIDRENTLVDIVAYCLMPNHFHLILKEKEENGISRFMQKMTTGYTMYFNKRHDRSGNLFQGKFKAKHIDNDEYFKYLISYIHLNPIKIIDPKWMEDGIKNKDTSEKYLDNFPYSSYLDYIGFNRMENKIINNKALPDYFEMPKDFKANVTEWLSYIKNI